MFAFMIEQLGPSSGILMDFLWNHTKDRWYGPWNAYINVFQFAALKSACDRPYEILNEAGLYKHQTNPIDAFFAVRSVAYCRRLIADGHDLYWHDADGITCLQWNRAIPCCCVLIGTKIIVL